MKMLSLKFLPEFTLYVSKGFYMIIYIISLFMFTSKYMINLIIQSGPLTLLHSERPKLHRVLAVVSAIGLIR